MSVSESVSGSLSESISVWQCLCLCAPVCCVYTSVRVQVVGACAFL